MKVPRIMIAISTPHTYHGNKSTDGSGSTTGGAGGTGVAGCIFSSFSVFYRKLK